jgi:hypothetical protein
MSLQCLYILRDCGQKNTRQTHNQIQFPRVKNNAYPLSKKLKSMPQNMPISFLASFKIKIPSDCFDPIFVAKENKENYHDSQQY